MASPSRPLSLAGPWKHDVSRRSFVITSFVAAAFGSRVGSGTMAQTLIASPVATSIPNSKLDVRPNGASLSSD